MRYTIHRYKDGSHDTEVWPDSSLKEAREYAMRVTEDGLADRVEVRDDNGRLVLNVPRMLRRG